MASAVKLTVEVDNAALITTTGNSSTGILAQSVGGGGGNGGYCCKRKYRSFCVECQYRFRWQRWGRWSGRYCKIINKAQIVTSGSSSSAIVSQSIGGAGGMLAAQSLLYPRNAMQ